MAFRLPSGRGDEFAHGSAGSEDPRDRAPPPKPRDLFVRDLHIDTLKLTRETFSDGRPLVCRWVTTYRAAMMDDPVNDAFKQALERFADGYTQGMFDGRTWGVTVKRSADHKRIWFYAEDLAGSDIVSFNLYRLNGAGLKLKPCEMSSEKITSFVLGFDNGSLASTGPV